MVIEIIAFLILQNIKFTGKRQKEKTVITSTPLLLSKQKISRVKKLKKDYKSFPMQVMKQKEKL